MLVNNIDLAWQERSSALLRQPRKFGIFEQQALEFEPGRAWLDVGEILLGELHAALGRWKFFH